MFKFNQERTAETAVKTANLFQKFARAGNVFVMLVVVTALFNGCKKEDDSKTSFSKDNIVGSWELTNASGYIKEIGNIVEEWQSISYKTMGDEMDIITDNFVQRTGDIWKFNSDGTVTATINGDSETISFTVSGNNLTFTGSWYDKWNERQVEEVVFVIKELKADKLVVSFLGQMEEGYVTFYEEYTFKKVSSNGTVNPDNSFIGTWVAGSVSIIIDATTWTAKYGSSVYNSGTYTYSDNSAQLKVTNKGSGSAAVGSTGTATVSGSKLTVSSFSDSNMNGVYTKK